MALLRMERHVTCPLVASWQWCSMGPTFVSLKASSSFPRPPVIDGCPVVIGGLNWMALILPSLVCPVLVDDMQVTHISASGGGGGMNSPLRHLHHLS